VKRFHAGLFVLLVLALAPIVDAQARVADPTLSAGQSTATDSLAAASVAKYKKEPYIIEKYETSVRFGDDGTQTRTVYARVLIQSSDAAERFGRLVFSYDSAAAKLDFQFVRVLKPDGRHLHDAVDSAQQVAAAAIRDAPAYSNYLEKSISVPELQAGDTLEYQVVTTATQALVPGEFWMQHTFLADAIVLSENLTIDAPEPRRLHLSSPRFRYSTDVSSPAGRVVYRWQHANLTVPLEDEQPKSTAEQKAAKHADVELATFASWDAVSSWYAKLEKAHGEPSPEIRAKVAELIRNRSSDLEKMQALFAWVSHDIRYIELPIGAAGYEPHSAAQIFNNRYGDAEDKNVLLAAMLRAAGIRSETALLSDSRAFNPSLPSPAQFAHVITVVPQSNNLLWADSTLAVAPLGFLPASLRGRSALLIAPEGSEQITKTPVDPPFLSTQRVQIEGQVSELGKLAAHIHYELRGDNEFVLRLAFYRSPQAQWKDLAQTILALDGVHGEVSAVTTSAPTDTENPFVVDIEYSQNDFLDWSSQRAKVPVPLLAIGMPDAPKKNRSVSSIEIGSPLEVTARLKLTLPDNFASQPPVAIAVARDYAEFKSSYGFENHTLAAERFLRFKMRDLPASRADDYLAFSRAVAADQNQPLLITNSSSGGPDTPPAASVGELFEAATAALASGHTRSSIALLERVVELNPTHQEAWEDLGLSYMRSGQLEPADIAFRRQLEVNPSDPQAHNYLGLVLQRELKYEEAAAAFRAQAALNPLDPVAHAALGAVYFSQHRYSEAIPELDKATVLSPNGAELQISLGRAYLNVGANDKALAAFEKGLELSPTAALLSEVADSLAEHKLELGQSQKYAESAVRVTAANLQGIDLAHVTADQLNREADLANYWDTLGWVYFQQGHLDSAEKFIRSAWLLDARGRTAGHLGQIQEKRGDKLGAIHTYALALAAPQPDPDSRARLTLLLGGNAAIEELIDRARPELARLRTIPVGNLLHEDAQADFLILLSAGARSSHDSHARAVRFVSGAEKLRASANSLLSLDYGEIFPSVSPIELVRRGTISCAAAGGHCTFTLLPLGFAQAGN
jgi:tetratricopeptide (TPR) repeat protein/transglutaminase-like putative cysteine protease